MPEVRSGGFPHSELHGYDVCRRLPMAFRSLPRPSSALGAKASTLCPYDLILGIALLSIRRAYRSNHVRTSFASGAC